MRKQPKQSAALDLAIEVASFYGGLRAGGVPESAATQIAGQYATAAYNARILIERGVLPRDREPWEGE